MLLLIIVRKIASKNQMELSAGTKLSKSARNAIAAGKMIAQKIAVGLKEQNIRQLKSLVHLSPKETAVLAKVHVAPILVHSTWERSVWMTMVAEKRVTAMEPPLHVLCHK